MNANLVQPLLTAEDLANWLGVTVWQIRRMTAAGDLPPAVRIGRRIRWRPEAVSAWLAEIEAPCEALPQLSRATASRIWRPKRDDPPVEKPAQGRGRPSKSEEIAKRIREQK